MVVERFECIRTLRMEGIEKTATRPMSMDEVIAKLKVQKKLRALKLEENIFIL